MRDVLIQQRAWVQHWIADLAAGLTPTRGSLEAALAALETHLTQGALAVDTIKERYMVWVSLVMSTGRDGRMDRWQTPTRCRN
jgi:hypothetical protein